MRKLIVLALVVGSLGVLASVAMAATKSVKVGDNYYVRPKGVPKVTVTKGTKVKFNFSRASNPHTVTRLSGPSFKTCSEHLHAHPEEARARTGSTARSTAGQTSR